MKNKFISIAIVALLIITIEFAFAQNVTALEQNFKFEGVWSSRSDYSSDETFECFFSFENEGYYSEYFIIYYLYYPSGHNDYDTDCGDRVNRKCAIGKGESRQHQTYYSPPTEGWEPGEYRFCPEVYGPGGVATGKCTSFTVKATTPPVTTSPIINTVHLNLTTPKTGDNILVTVNATDDNKVTSVKAEDISLTNDIGYTWEGTIVALEGTHTVHVLASDEDGNIVWDNSTSYSTITDVETDVIYVDDGGGKDYYTIQDAVNNASNNNTIIVYSGTYAENVIVDKSLKIISESNMPDNTIVQAADPESDVFYVSADDVTISGFSITGANGNYMVAGIYLDDVQHNMISNNKLSNNFDGIYLGESDYNKLIDNIANSNEDNGIYLDNSSNNELNNNDASNNNWHGISLGGSSLNILSNNTINLNNGSGMIVGNSSNNKFNNNDLDNNLYGIVLVNSNSNILNDNNASDNTWNGIHLDNSSNNELTDNNASNNDLHGISLRGSGLNILSNNIINLNNISGMFVGNSSNNKLNNNDLDNNQYGIVLVNSSSNMLNDNNALDNYNGIWLENSCTNNLSNNIIQNSNNGITIMEYSTSNSLINNTATNNEVGLVINQSSDNCIYNNYFNNTNNVLVENTQSQNIWNTTKTEGTNIVAGPFIGGNYWAYPNGTGFGQVCEDVDKDGICDLPYDIAGDSFDYLPLSIKWTSDSGSSNDSDSSNDGGSSNGGSSKSSGSSKGIGSGASGEAYDNILLSETDRENVYKDSKVSYSYNKEGNPIHYINFTGVTSSGQIAVKVEILKNTSSLVDQLAPYITYKNLDIWAGKSRWATSKNIADPTVSFKVEKSWISSNAIDESTITLYRYNDKKWNLLSTTKIGEDDEYLNFESKTSGFSPFAITGKGTQTLSEETTRPGEGGVDSESESSTEDEEEPEQTSTQETGIPGFGICASLLILSGAFRLLRKKE